MSTATLPDQDWRTRGACRDYDPDWWTSQVGDECLAWALWICRARCPVRRTCLRWAQDNPHMAEGGVYGGELWARGHAHDNPSRVPRPATRIPRPSPPVTTRPPLMRADKAA